MLIKTRVFSIAGQRRRSSFVLASCSPIGFFDLSAVRRLTMDVERTRKLLQASARSYALADAVVPGEADALYRLQRAAHLEACFALVNALHDYWPEYFGHDVPF